MLSALDNSSNLFLRPSIKQRYHQTRFVYKETEDQRDMLTDSSLYSSGLTLTLFSQPLLCLHWIMYYGYVLDFGQVT